MMKIDIVLLKGGGEYSGQMKPAKSSSPDVHVGLTTCEPNNCQWTVSLTVYRRRTFFVVLHVCISK